MSVEVRLRVGEDGELSGYVKNYRTGQVKKLAPTADKTVLRSEVAKAIQTLEPVPVG